MSPLDAFVLISIMTLPPIACKVGYRLGQKDALARFKAAEGIRLRYCQCHVQKDTK